MKKVSYTGFAICLLAMLYAVSCSDNSFYGIQSKEKFTHEKGSSETVTLLVGDYGRKISESKAVGAVIDRYSWAENNADIKVYAFRKDSSCLNSLATDKNSACLIDGTLDNEGVKSGRLATFTAPEYVVSWPLSDKVLQYPSNNTPYNFFAYHTGKYEVPESKITRDASYISIPAKIDGATDLMFAESELTKSQIELLPYLGLAAEDSAGFRDVCFSGYSASLGINPTLNFNHSLAWFCFDMYPGESGCNKVVVKRVTVSTRDSCMFTVATADSLNHPLGADFSIDEKNAQLNLLEKDGSPLSDTLYHTSYHGDFTEDILERPHIRIGGGFLLPPDEEYVFDFYTYVKGNDYSIKTEITVHPIKNEVFEAGSLYVIRIRMNDLIPVVFSTSIDSWQANQSTNSTKCY